MKTLTLNQRLIEFCAQHYVNAYENIYGSVTMECTFFNTPEIELHNSLDVRGSPDLVELLKGQKENPRASIVKVDARFAVMGGRGGVKHGVEHQNA